MLLFAVSIWCGYKSGVFVRLIKVAALVLAFYAAFFFAAVPLGWFPDGWMDDGFEVFNYEFEPGQVPYWLFAALIFVTVWMVGRLVARLFEAARPKGLAVGPNNVFGAVYGAVRGLLLALLIVALARLSPTIVEHQSWQHSEFAPKLEIVLNKVLAEVPPEFTQYFEPVEKHIGEDGIEDLYEDSGF